MKMKIYGGLRKYRNIGERNKQEICNDIVKICKKGNEIFFDTRVLVIFPLNSRLSMEPKGIKVTAIDA